MNKHFTVKEKVRTLQIMAGMTPPFDCMDLANEYQEEHGERWDWHEFSAYLSELESKKLLKVVRPGGMTGYAFNLQDN